MDRRNDDQLENTLNQSSTRNINWPFKARSSVNCNIVCLRVFYFTTIPRLWPFGFFCFKKWWKFLLFSILQANWYFHSKFNLLWKTSMNFCKLVIRWNSVLIVINYFSITNWSEENITKIQYNLRVGKTQPICSVQYL